MRIHIIFPGSITQVCEALVFAVLLTVSTTAIGENKGPSKKYLAYLGCVDAEATVYFRDGIDVDESIDKGISKCKKALKKYLRELLAYSKRQGGWNRLDSTVAPAVKKAVIESTFSLLRPVYLQNQNGGS